MAVSLVGSPSTARSTTATVTLASWAQNPTAGNLLVAVIGGGGSTAASFNVSQATGTTGWAQLLSAPIGNNTAGTDDAGVDVWFKVAGAGEPLPGFTAVVSGTLATQLVVFELSGAAPALDTSGSVASGSSSATVTFSATTAASVAAAGEFAISAFVQERTATTVTWSETGTGWTSAFSDGTTSSRAHIQVNSKANPASGAALNDAGSFSTNSLAFGAGVVVVIKASVAKASSDAGTGTETGSVFAAVSDVESAGLTETQSVTQIGPVSVSGADSGTGADVSTSAGMNLSDAGSGAEAAGLVVSLASADAGSGLETSRLGLAQADACAGVDTGSAAASAASPDAGTGAEAAGISLAAIDAGSATESAGATAAVPGADTGTGTDAAVSVGTGAADTGASAEAQSPSAAVPASDGGHGTEQGIVLGLTQQVSDSDVAAGAEAYLISIASAELAGSAEASGLLARLLGTDAGSGLGSEGVISSGPLNVTDSDAASGTDRVVFAGSALRFVADADAATGIDGILDEWGTSWGAVGMDCYALGPSVGLEAGSSGLVLLAEQGDLQGHDALRRDEH